MLSMLGRVSASVFLPVRHIAGPLHRRKHLALSGEEEDRERDAAPLPPPWCDDNRWYRSDFCPWHAAKPPDGPTTVVDAGTLTNATSESAQVNSPVVGCSLVLSCYKINRRRLSSANCSGSFEDMRYHALQGLHLKGLEKHAAE